MEKGKEKKIDDGEEDGEDGERKRKETNWG